MSNKLMSNKCSPEPANRVVTLYSTINSEEGGVAVAEQCRTVRRGVSRAALYLAHVGPPPQETPAAMVEERPEKPIWSSAFDFLVEGFANCAAPLYPPMAYFDAGGLLLETDVPLREALAASERRVSLVPLAPRRSEDDQATTGLALASEIFLERPSFRGRSLPDRDLSHRILSEQGLIDRGLPDRELPVQRFADSDALPSQEIQRPNRWSWLTSSWEVVAAIWVHMRREREIRKAIDALAELDDFTLKDIGIHHRSQIEYAVRHGHDC